MFKVNDNFLKLPGSYLFSTIGKKVNAYAAAHPHRKIIRLGIGDVTQPLAPAIVKALHGAVEEMGDAATFRGYAPDLGSEFLRNAIAAISRRFSVWITGSRYVTRSIPCMWIPM